MWTMLRDAKGVLNLYDALEGFSASIMAIIVQITASRNSPISYLRACGVYRLFLFNLHGRGETNIDFSHTDTDEKRV